VVFKLVKLLIGVVGLGAFCFWGATVPLGEHTLFGHIAAIGHSKESQELVRGTKEKVGDLKKRIAGAEPPKAEKSAKSETAEKVDKADKAEHAAPQERLSHVDRKEIRHFIDSARGKIAKTN
jgi:hypothetical protein